MIKAVIFDLDDTLTPELEFVRSGFREVSKELAVTSKLDTQVIYESLISAFSEDSKNVFDRVSKSLGLDLVENDILHLVELYRNHYPKISFYDDVIPTLMELMNKGIKLGMITDGFKVSQRNKLKALDAEKYFDQVIVTDELGKDFSKPNPKSFEIMKQNLGVDYGEIIYVGDNPQKDFYIAKYHPIHTCRINRNGVYLNADYYKNVHEEFKLDSLRNLIELIDTIG
jgi:putative hydrolase of the HAD superfamily